jgi:hypothetical protein
MKKKTMHTERHGDNRADTDENPPRTKRESAAAAAAFALFLSRGRPNREGFALQRRTAGVPNATSPGSIIIAAPGDLR